MGTGLASCFYNLQRLQSCFEIKIYLVYLQITDGQKQLQGRASCVQSFPTLLWGKGSCYIYYIYSTLIPRYMKIKFFYGGSWKYGAKSFKPPASQLGEGPSFSLCTLTYAKTKMFFLH